MIYARYTSEAAALRAAKAPLKLLHPAKYEDGRGLPPGKSHGGATLEPGKGYTTQAVPVMPGKDGSFYVAADEALPERSVEIDGFITVPARIGATMDDFKDVDDADNEPRMVGQP